VALLEQVPQFKYRWITEDEKCDCDIKTGIGIVQNAFWKHIELLKKGNKLFIC